MDRLRWLVLLAAICLQAPAFGEKLQQLAPVKAVSRVVNLSGENRDSELVSFKLN